MPLGLQPSFPILLSRVFLMDWGGGGSGEVEAELPKSIPTYRMVRILSVHTINKQQSWKKTKILFLTAAHSLYLSLSKQAEQISMRLKLPTEPPDFQKDCPSILAHKMSLGDCGGHVLFFRHSTPILTTAPWLPCEELPPPVHVVLVRQHISVSCPSPDKAHHPAQYPPSLQGLWVSNARDKDGNTFRGDPLQVWSLISPVPQLFFRFCESLIAFFFFFNWRIADLQSCVSFRHTPKWFSYTYTSILFQILFRYRLLQDTECSSLLSLSV